MLVQSKDAQHVSTSYNQNYYNTNGSAIVRKYEVTYTERLSINALNAIIQSISDDVQNGMNDTGVVLYDVNNMFGAYHNLTMTMHSINTLLNTVYRFSIEYKISEVRKSLDNTVWVIGEVQKMINECKMYAQNIMVLNNDINQLIDAQNQKNMIVRLIEKKQFNRKIAMMKAQHTDSIEQNRLNISRINNELKRIKQFISGTYVHQY